mgnify:CR=1 FL=1
MPAPCSRQLHNLPFTGPFVVDAAQVQDTMNNHPVKLAVVGLLKLFRIGADSIQTDE